MSWSRFARLAGVTAAGTLLCAVLLQSRTLSSSSGTTAQSSRQPAAQPPSQGIRFTTPPGFAVERINPVDKLDSYVVLTFDSLGRIVVSKENDFPRLLLDNDGDGIYEAEKVITDKVRNCQGLWFDGRTMYGNCAPGELPPPAPVGGPPANNARSALYKVEDRNEDDVLDTLETLNDYVGGIQEHGPHAIRRGPDGEMTLIWGNNTFVQDDLIDPLTPLSGFEESQLLPALPDGRGFGPSVKEGAHSVISRFDRRQKHFTFIVTGMRNAYDYAFNLAGEVFTFDSDMEWDINEPWYREVRSVHGIPGGNYGYRNGSGKFPSYYIDSLPPMRDLGRGSPVGVEFYQHHVYPTQFHDAYLEADWSRGRLLWTGLAPAGATYKAIEEKTELVHGEPLNITDLEVGPDGLVYFTIGGRLTEGGLYRVKYTGPPTARAKLTPVLAVVRQPQPLSSWGWAAIERAKAAMGESWAVELEKLARDGKATRLDRAQAIYILQRHGPAPSGDLLNALLTDKDPGVRAAVAYVAGVQGDAGRAVAAAALADSDPLVKRRAAEALVRQGLSADRPSFAPIDRIYPLLGSSDRFVRYSGRKALQRTPRNEWKDKVLAESNPVAAIEGLVALVETATSEADLEPVFQKHLGLLAKTSLPVEDRLRAVRAFQLAAIEAKGASPELRKQLHDVLVTQFPARDERLNRELALTLAWAGQPAAIARILAAMPSGDANQPLQLHYIYALRAIKNGWTKDQKVQLMDWFAKATPWRGGASFPGFLNLMFDASLTFFDDSEKKLAYEKVPQFAPLTEAELAASVQQRMTQTRAGRPPSSPANARVRGVNAISRDEIFDELIFTPQRQAPSLTAGKAAFEQVCASCHRFGPLGTDIGPDLSTIASRFKKRDIVEAILWPSKAISDQYDVTMVEMTDGNTLAGFVVSDNGPKLTMRTADVSGRPFEIEKSKVRRRTKSPVSMMPEGLVDELTQQQIAGLIAFLQAPPPQ